MIPFSLRHSVNNRMFAKHPVTLSKHCLLKNFRLASLKSYLKFKYLKKDPKRILISF